jgi:predicted ferric reductase
MPESRPVSKEANHPSGLGGLLRAAIGRRSDWRVSIPEPGALGIGRQLIGIAFSGATGEDGSVALGLFVGAAAITLMTWSFFLAIRVRALEPLFGGLDRMYQVHRWAGTLAMAFMFLHVRLEPEVEGGFRGASKSVADSAEGLAGVGEYMLCGLVAISLIRWFPYRWWRLTHKLLGVPFAFACFQFYTAEKPYENGSGWGWYFGTIMTIGLVSYVVRVVGRDALTRGKRYRVASAVVQGSTIELNLSPERYKLEHRAGEFAIIKIQERGMSEPHVFTIASAPESANLRFFVRNLGDWSKRLQSADLVGTTVYVEGPYGAFEPFADSGGDTLWIAGGIGITPFLSAIDQLESNPLETSGSSVPTLIYCVPTRRDATAIEHLERANAAGRIRLHVLASDEGRRFSPSLLTEVSDGQSLANTHTAVCGPTGLVRAATRATRAAGARSIENEAFDIRSGIGPDLSQPIADLTSR